MKIYIFDEIIDRQDAKTIIFLTSHSFYKKNVLKIKNICGIPRKGIDCLSAELKGDFLSDFKGIRIELKKPFPKENTQSAYKYMADFLDEPSMIFPKEEFFRKEVEKIRDFFHLDKRWYYPICHLIIFNQPGWLHSPITVFVKDPEKKDLWNKPGAIIQVSENITKTELSNWIQENWDEIRERMEDELKIKKISKNSLPKKHPLVFLGRIMAAKERGVKLSKIADEISTSTEEHGFLSDLQNLSNIISRYSR